MDSKHLGHTIWNLFFSVFAYFHLSKFLNFYSTTEMNKN